MKMKQRIDYRLIVLMVVAVVALVGAQLGQNAAASPPPSPSPFGYNTTVQLTHLQTQLEQNPDNTTLYAELGLLMLQRAQETGDPTYYLQAEQALATSLAQNPDELHALLGQGLLALARHDFPAALQWGEKARASYPYNAEALGILVDAQVELGQYDAAATTLKAMLDLRPGLAAFSRASYLRELHGDMPGAIEAMQRAVASGVPGQEATLWAQVQLGHLYFASGDLAQAETTYRLALRFQPDYLFAEAGLARVEAARGNYAAALSILEMVTARYPLAEFVILLGDVYTAAGQPDAAAQQYDLVRVIQQLNASAGMAVDLELALFEADHGNPAEAVRLAQAAYEQRPTVVAADVLAWALYQAGDMETAWQYSQESLKLGTQDALFYFHAGMIAYERGDAATARAHLQQALDLNPSFSLLHRPLAEATLARV